MIDLVKVRSFKPDRQDTLFDGQRIIVSSNNKKAFPSSPVQITEKLRKTAFHPVFCSGLSPHDATGRNPRCRGVSFSGIRFRYF